MPEKQRTIEKQNTNEATTTSNKFIDNWRRKILLTASGLFSLSTIVLGAATIYGFVSGDATYSTAVVGGGAGGSMVMAGITYLLSKE